MYNKLGSVLKRKDYVCAGQSHPKICSRPLRCRKHARHNAMRNAMHMQFKGEPIFLVQLIQSILTRNCPHPHYPIYILQYILLFSFVFPMQCFRWSWRRPCTSTSCFQMLSLCVAYHLDRTIMNYIYIVIFCYYKLLDYDTL